MIMDVGVIRFLLEKGFGRKKHQNTKNKKGINMDINTKVLLVRVLAGVGLVALVWLGWWMDYKWKRSPFYRGENKE